jgi:hypothetical protein
VNFALKAEEIMGDIKKMISEKIGAAKSTSSIISYTTERSKEAENEGKARKILGFAIPILREFAKQVGQKVFRKSNKDGYGFRNCMARFEICETNFLGIPKKASDTLEIIIGKEGGKCNYGEHSYYNTGCPLILGGREYGKDVDINQINEEWFIGELAKEYEEMRRRALFRWR